MNGGEWSKFGGGELQSFGIKRRIIKNQIVCSLGIPYTSRRVRGESFVFVAVVLLLVGGSDQRLRVDNRPHPFQESSRGWGEAVAVGVTGGRWTILLLPVQYCRWDCILHVLKSGQVGNRFLTFL